MNLLPAPNISQGTDNNYVGDVKKKFHQNWTDQRGDWNIHDNDKFFGRYSYFSTLLANAAAVWTRGRRTVAGRVKSGNGKLVSTSGGDQLSAHV